MDQETIELLLSNRSFLYALTARGFAEEPDGVFADILAGPHAREEAGLVELPETGAIVALLGDLSLRLAKPDGMTAAAREYVRMFVGPGTLSANPWETVQLTGNRTLFQSGVLDVRGAYRAAGFEPVRVREVPDDFIGVELDFMAKMAEKALAEFQVADPSWSRTLRLSGDFLRDHLGAWAGLLADSIEAAYADTFYAGFSRFTALVIERDMSVIAALLA